MKRRMELQTMSRTLTMSMRQPAEKMEQTLKTLIEARDNDGIIRFLESKSSNRNEEYKFAVLQLTVLNDPETLHSILKWGKEKSLTPGTGADKDNPILVACQQDFRRCMKSLYQHGYRMKERKDEVDEEEDDQVKQFLRFEAASNIYYLSLEFTEHQVFQKKDKDTKLAPDDITSLEEIDPIRKVFDIMADADHNMEDFQGSSELKDSYTFIKNKLETFTGGILTQCRGMHEVKTILDHNKDDDDDDELDDAHTNWQEALFKGHKDIVSHPNFQQYLWRKMAGDGSINTEIPFKFLTDKPNEVGVSEKRKKTNLSSTTKFRMKRVLWNIKNFPLTILTFLLCYPFVVVADFLRKGDILFVSPKALEARRLKDMETNIEKQQTDKEGSPQGCFDYFRKRMHIPLFRMIPYFSAKVTYLILLFVSIWHPVDPMVEANFQQNILLWITFFISISYLVDDIIQIFRTKIFNSFWNYFSLLTHLLLVGGAVLLCVSYHFSPKGTKLADLSGNSAENVGLALFSFGAGMEFFCVMQWLILLETTGPMVLCVLHAIKDALRMVSIYIVLFVAHSIAFISLYKPFHPDPSNSNTTQELNTTKYVLANGATALKSQRGLISTLFWRIIASAGPEMVNINNTKEPTDDFSLEFSHLMGLVLWGVYQIIVYVLMLNLLIAVMNTSYSELWQNAQRECKYHKSCFLAKFMEPLEIFPVPFRWIYYLARVVYFFKKEKNPIKQDKSKYFWLLQELILNKQEAEDEKSDNDKMNDLRMDIFNELRKFNNPK